MRQLWDLFQIDPPPGARSFRLVQPEEFVAPQQFDDICDQWDVPPDHGGPALLPKGDSNNDVGYVGVIHATEVTLPSKDRTPQEIAAKFEKSFYVFDQAKQRTGIKTSLFQRFSEGKMVFFYLAFQKRKQRWCRDRRAQKIAGKVGPESRSGWGSNAPQIVRPERSSSVCFLISWAPEILDFLPSFHTVVRCQVSETISRALIFDHSPTASCASKRQSKNNGISVRSFSQTMTQHQGQSRFSARWFWRIMCPEE